MKPDPAWRVIQSAYRCSAELQELLRFLKEHGGTEEYERYRLPIAAAIHAVNEQLTSKALAERPELEQRIESDLAAFGRIV